MNTSSNGFSNCTLLLAIAFALVSLTPLELHANPGYSAKSGKIEFNVGSNLPLVKVSGSSSALNGGGEASVAEDTAIIRNLRFEVDPATFKTGIKLRDQHLYEKVFTAPDGSMPKIVLQAESFQAKLDPETSKWEGNLRAQLTIRGVTRPVSFRATAEKKGEGAVVTAEATVKTSEFGVKPISYSGATVEDEVAVTVRNLVIEP